MKKGLSGMYRYIAMVWNEADASATKTAEHIRNKTQKSPTSWQMAYESNGLTVLHTGEHKGRMQACKLDNSGGVILGKLFKTSPSGEHSSVDYNLGEGESQKINKTSGKHLIEHYWGRYMAFLKDNDTYKISVLKAPIEGFNCYYTNFHGVTLYFSSFEDITQLNFLNLSINWRYVAGYLMYRGKEKIDTAFDQLFQLQPGECRQHRRSEVTNIILWDMVSFSARADIIEDPIEAAQKLRETVITCVSAWAKNHDKIIHKLSGGLDSSIVLACLIQSRNAEDICCLNYFPLSDKSGDERYFAQVAAKHYGVQLIEKELDPTKARLEQLFDISPLPIAGSYRNAMVQYPYQAQLARKMGASVLFAGEGGDSLFFEPATHYVTSDYLQKYGLTSKLFRVALNNALRLKKSVWSVLYDAVKDRIMRQPVKLIDMNESSLLNLDILKNLKNRDILNSMIENANDLPKGKLFHISMLGLPNDYYYTGRADDFLEVCSPLLSQPVIELGLRIPSYVLTVGGKERALARMAFKNDLPKEILGRGSKGGLETHLQENLDQNIDFVRELLLNGVLVKEKMLNRDELEKSLAGGQATINLDTHNILYHVYTEIWLRKMMEVNIKIAA